MNEISKLSKKYLRRIPQSEQLGKTTAFERGLIGMAGAWICRIRHTEAKYMVAKHLWEWAEHIQLLRHRLSEMPGGRPDLLLEDHFVKLLDECMFAEDDKAYLEVLYHVLLPHLLETYQAYQKLTQELPDRPTLYLLNNIVKTLQEQIENGTSLLVKKYKQINSVSSENYALSSPWVNHIKELLHLTGGILGKPELSLLKAAMKNTDQKYVNPHLQHRENGTHFTYNFPPIEGIETIFTGDLELDRVLLALWLYNEMDAAEYIPTILYEIKGMPWEFYYDVARHTWDEARHSEFGYHLLPKLGFQRDEFEVCSATYMSTITLQPHERYAAVTYWYEPGSFLIKPDFMEKLAQEIDDTDLAVQLLRFDLADETTHVKYGHKWVGKLMQHYGDQRTVDELVNDVKTRCTTIREAQAAAFTRTMPMEKRLSVTQLKARIEEWKTNRGGTSAVYN